MGRFLSKELEKKNWHENQMPRKWREKGGEEHLREIWKE